MYDMVSQSVGVELGRWNVLGCVMDVARKLDCVVIIFLILTLVFTDIGGGGLSGKYFFQIFISGQDALDLSLLHNICNLFRLYHNQY